MTLYDRIRELRIALGMSQEDLAHKMGYKDRSMITKIESGKVDISQKKIVAFAKALSTTPAYLMGWVEDNTRPMNLQLFSDSSLLPDEQLVLDTYRSLSVAGKQYLQTQLTIASTMFGEKSDPVDSHG